MRRIAPSAALLVAWNASCGGPCGIPAPVIVQAHLAVTSDALANATLVCCQNSLCAAGVLGSTAASSATGDFDAFVFADAEDEVAGPSFVEIQVYPRVPPLVLVEGDSYSLTIADANGKPLFDATKTVGAYPTVEPCGHGDTKYTHLLVDLNPP